MGGQWRSEAANPPKIGDGSQASVDLTGAMCTRAAKAAGHSGGHAGGTEITDDGNLQNRH